MNSYRIVRSTLEHGAVYGTEEFIANGIDFLMVRLRFLGCVYFSHFGHDGGTFSFLAHIAFALVWVLLTGKLLDILMISFFAFQGRVYEQIL